MGKKLVLQVECDRCTRVEHRTVNPTDKPEKEEPILDATFLGQRVVYKDLCSACTDIVTTRLAEVIRNLTKASPQREKKGKATVVEAKAVAPVDGKEKKVAPAGTSPRP
jgi:hypothetical protein